MKLRSSVIALVVVLVSAVLACSSEGKVGESCGESGVGEGECEAGGICGKDTAGALYCLKVCVDQSQCTATEDCNGVEGSSTKACRPKDTKK
jgi:hypothetical protein